MSTELAEYEKILRQDPSQAGPILLHVRDHGLWRRHYPTFEMWCDGRGFTRARVRELIADAEQAQADGKPAEWTRADAERLTVRIRVKLDTLADDYETVLPLIREAIDRRAHELLGYPSIGAYAAARFGGSLARLDALQRRSVVGELTADGMSTRDVALVAGVSQSTAARDARSLVSHDDSPPAPVRVTGHDGKSYPRPEPVVTGDVLDPVKPEHVHIFVCSCGKQKS